MKGKAFKILISFLATAALLVILGENTQRVYKTKKVELHMLKRISE